MGWSFRVGRLAGIDVYVHFTFFLLLGWVALTGYVSTGSLVGAAVGLALIGIIFFIIVLHELGHALAAR
jgi:Zn-dependent protease